MSCVTVLRNWFRDCDPLSLCTLGGVHEVAFAKECRKLKLELRNGGDIEGLSCDVGTATFALEVLEHSALCVPSALRASRSTPVSARVGLVPDGAPFPIVKTFDSTEATGRFAVDADVAVFTQAALPSAEAHEPATMFPSVMRSVLASVCHLLRIDEDCLKTAKPC